MQIRLERWSANGQTTYPAKMVGEEIGLKKFRKTSPFAVTSKKQPFISMFDNERELSLTLCGISFFFPFRLPQKDVTANGKYTFISPLDEIYTSLLGLLKLLGGKLTYPHFTPHGYRTKIFAQHHHHQATASAASSSSSSSSSPLS